MTKAMYRKTFFWLTILEDNSPSPSRQGELAEGRHDSLPLEPQTGNQVWTGDSMLCLKAQGQPPVTGFFYEGPQVLSLDSSGTAAAVLPS